MTDIDRTQIIRLLALFSFALATTSAHSTSLDLRMIHFMAGHPLVGESLEQSLDNSVQSQVENLSVNVSILKEYPNVPYDLKGRASEIECKPASCMTSPGVVRNLCMTICCGREFPLARSSQS